MARMKTTKFNLRTLWARFTNKGGDNAGGGAADGAVSTAEQSMSVSLDDVATPPADDKTATTEPAKIDFNAYLSDDLKGKEYFQNIAKAEDPIKELISQFDNAQGLIGKRVGVPKDDAPQEEWDKYFEAIRPKEASAYEFKPVELEDKELEAYVNGFRDEEDMKAVQGIFHKWGVPKKVAEGIVADYEKHSSGRVKTLWDAQKTSEAELEKNFEEVFKVFGAERSQAEKYGRQVINEFVPANLKQYVDGLPNESLAVIAAMGMGVHKKYEKGDVLIDGAKMSSGSSLLDVQKQLNEVLASDAYRQSTHVNNDHARKQAAELSKRIAELRKST